MIKVVVHKVGQEITKIEVSGHAYTNDPGYDLVCAGISSIMTGALNGFDQLDDSCELTLNNDPYISIECKYINDINQILLQFVLVQIKTVHAAHSDAIKIIEKEGIR